jgi:cytochrome c oxidase assembly protein subunit 15
MGEIPHTPYYGSVDSTPLFLILLAQGVIGYVQYFTNLPEVLVGLHMLGSALVWIGVLRVLFALRERPGTASPADVPGPATETTVAARA